MVISTRRHAPWPRSRRRWVTALTLPPATRSPTAPGFAKVLIRPTPPAALDHASASVDTVRGLVASSWQRTGNHLQLTVEVPGNTTAEVDVPVSDGGSVHVSDRRGVRYLRTGGGYASYEVSSGQHHFLSAQ